MLGVFLESPDRGNDFGYPQLAVGGDGGCLGRPVVGLDDGCLSAEFAEARQESVFGDFPNLFGYGRVGRLAKLRMMMRKASTVRFQERTTVIELFEDFFLTTKSP